MEKKRTDNPAALRSRKALANAFVELLTERPIGQITISDITKRAGLSRQTFYTNFSKKEDILENSLKELFLMFSDSVREFPEHIEEMLAVYFQFWSEHQTFLSVLFKNHFSYIFAVNNVLLFQNECAAYTKQAAKAEAEIPFLERYLAGLTFQMLRTWQKGGWDRPVDEVTDIACRLLRGECFS